MVKIRLKFVLIRSSLSNSGSILLIYVFFILPSCRTLSIAFGNGCSSLNSSRTSASVDIAPVPVFLPVGVSLA